MFASSVLAQNEINHNNYAALAKCYENLAKEAETNLQENKEILKQYEAHPYYYGRKGQELQSHTLANIREYEKAVKARHMQICIEKWQYHKIKSLIKLSSIWTMIPQ